VHREPRSHPIQSQQQHCHISYLSVVHKAKDQDARLAVYSFPPILGRHGPLVMAGCTEPVPKPLRFNKLLLARILRKKGRQPLRKSSAPNIPTQGK
jgi:hypothetical protein